MSKHRYVVAAVVVTEQSEAGRSLLPEPDVLKVIPWGNKSLLSDVGAPETPYPATQTA